MKKSRTKKKFHIENQTGFFWPRFFILCLTIFHAYYLVDIWYVPFICWAQSLQPSKIYPFFYVVIVCLSASLNDFNDAPVSIVSISYIVVEFSAKFYLAK